jgi:Ca-activated chloride channel homolog
VGIACKVQNRTNFRTLWRPLSWEYAETMKTLLVRYGLGVLLASAMASYAADQPEPSHFRAAANVVLVNATVLDRHNRPIRGLARDSFRLFENKAEQTIAYFGEEESPLSLVAIVDTSGSMESNLVGARRALGAILENANLADEFCLITFAERPQVAVGWTSNAAEVQNGVLLDRAHGRTTLLDAIQLGLSQIKRSHNPRRALAIFSDGGENYSRNSERDIARVLEEADVQLYAVDITGPAILRDRAPEEEAGPDLLSRLCDRAGGRYFPVEGERQLRQVAEQIGKELRSQYVLGYVPATGAADGKFHHVQLKLRRADGEPKVSLYWRRGFRYHAPFE